MSGWNRKPTVTANVDHRLVRQLKQTVDTSTGNRSLTVRLVATSRSPEGLAIVAVTFSSTVSLQKKPDAFLNTDQ